MRHITFALVSAAFVIEACASHAPPPAPPPPAPPRIMSATLEPRPLEVGWPAPDFEARSQDGSTVRLAALRGLTVILFFYTQDETPQSVREAMDFRDNLAELAQRGAVVIGISRDPVASHISFAESHHLNFPLLSDEGGEIGAAYGVPAPYGISDRQTIVIAPDGTIAKIYRQVDLSKQIEQIKADVEEGPPAKEL